MNLHAAPSCSAASLRRRPPRARSARVPRTATIPAGSSTAQSFPFTGIGVGATCVITEPTTGATTAVDVTSDAPQQVVITDTGATATITNTVTRRGDVAGLLPATGTETPLPMLWGGLVGLLGGALLVAASVTLLRKPEANRRRRHVAG